MENADLGNTVCSSISQVFPDDITYAHAWKIFLIYKDILVYEREYFQSL